MSGKEHLNVTRW